MAQHVDALSPEAIARIIGGRELANLRVTASAMVAPTGGPVVIDEAAHRQAPTVTIDGRPWVAGPLDESGRRTLPRSSSS